MAKADLNGFLSPCGIILSSGSVVLFDLLKADGEAEHGHRVEIYGAAWVGLAYSMAWHDVETCIVKHRPAWWHGTGWCWRGMALHEVIVWSVMQHAV